MTKLTPSNKDDSVIEPAAAPPELPVIGLRFSEIVLRDEMEQLTSGDARALVDQAYQQGNVRFRNTGAEHTQRADVWLNVKRSTKTSPRVAEVLLHVQPLANATTGVDDGEGTADPIESYVFVELRPQGKASALAELSFAVSQAIGGAYVQLDIRERGRPAAEIYLATDEPIALSYALLWATKSRAHDFLPRAAELLAHQDEQVARLAVEFVGLVGDKTHADRLIQHTRLAELGHTLRLYEALGRLGGKNAKGFLRFAVENEDDPERRAVAKQALDNLLRSVESTGQSDPGMVLPRGHRQ